MINDATAVATQNSFTMGVVDHGDGTIFFGEGDDFVKWSNVTIHREDAVGDDENERRVAIFFGLEVELFDLFEFGF